MIIISRIESGTAVASLTDFTQPRTTCPQCRHQTVMVSVLQKYYHLNWYPLFLKGKVFEVFCTHCNGLSKEKNFNAAVQTYVAEQARHASGRNRLLLLFCFSWWLGLLTFISLLIYMFYGN